MPQLALPLEQRACRPVDDNPQDQHPDCRQEGIQSAVPFQRNVVIHEAAVENTEHRQAVIQDQDQGGDEDGAVAFPADRIEGVDRMDKGMQSRADLGISDQDDLFFRRVND